MREPWFTAAELADIRLPGLPTSKRKVNELARANGWALGLDRTGQPLARPRPGQRGGGLEYHVSVLPPAASLALVSRGVLEPLPDELPANDTRDQAWASYDRLPEAAKAEALRRVEALDAIDALTASGLTVTAAIAATSAAKSVGKSTLAEWRALVVGAPAHDRLPRLAPRRRGGGREAEIDDGAWAYFLSDWLRPEKPAAAESYDRTLREYCAPRGLTLPCCRTLERRVEREIDARVVIARRQGAEALRRTLPPQQRSVADLHAMELVNIDGHKWDVFVRWPDGKIARPMMVAIQDVYSRKILAYRIGETESAVLTRLAFADLFRIWGIPKGCLMDNGRAFASKWITGGATSRFRFKIRPEEPTGLLTAMGVQIHWALPFRGQSKPIERAFKTLSSVARHPAFSGAYTGNKPDAKPENYGTAAVDLDTFKRVIALGIEAYNAKAGRRTEAAAGSSFDDVFQRSYEVSPIGRATPEQMRMALLAADEVSTDRRSGAVGIYGASYWAPELVGIAGQKVVVRFDPDDLTRPVHIYARNGAYLAEAPVWGRTPFLDAQGAQRRAKQEADLRKTTRKAADLQQLMTAQELAAFLPDEPEGAAPGDPKVIRPVRAPGGAAALKTVQQARPKTLPRGETTHERWAAAMERLTVVK